MSLTSDQAMNLINEFCIKSNVPFENILSFINIKKGGVRIQEKELGDIIRNDNLFREFEKYNQKLEALEELSRLGQELQPEDYEINNHGSRS